MMAGASACSDLGLAAAAVAAPAEEDGGCDCGRGLCGPYCCWLPLWLTASGECGHCCGWWSNRLRLPVLSCGSCRWQLSCGCGFVSRGPFRWRQQRILSLHMAAAAVLSLLLLATDAVAVPTVAASDGYDSGCCCVMAPASSAVVPADAAGSGGSCCGRR